MRKSPGFSLDSSDSRFSGSVTRVATVRQRGNTTTLHRVREIPALTLSVNRSEARPPCPDSCPSLHHINPNYRHCPLKPKYYSRGSPRLLSSVPGVCFTRFHSSKGVQCAETCFFLVFFLEPSSPQEADSLSAAVA